MTQCPICGNQQSDGINRVEVLQTLVWCHKCHSRLAIDRVAELNETLSTAATQLSEAKARIAELEEENAVVRAILLSHAEPHLPSARFLAAELDTVSR